MTGEQAPAHWNCSGKCYLCNDTVGMFDSKYVSADHKLICTVHRVKDWQAKGIDFSQFKYWSGE